MYAQKTLEEIQNSNLLDLTMEEQRNKIEMDVQEYLLKGGNIEVFEPQLSPAEERLIRIHKEYRKNVNNEEDRLHLFNV